MINDDELKAIERRALAATPDAVLQIGTRPSCTGYSCGVKAGDDGKARFYAYDFEDTYGYDLRSRSGELIYHGLISIERDAKMKESDIPSDAILFEHARTDILLLLAGIRSLKKALADNGKPGAVQGGRKAR